MTTKKVIVTILFISAMMQLSGQDTRISLSIKQSCQLGIEQNVDVRNSALEQQKAHYQLKEVQSRLYPQLEASANLACYKLFIPAAMLGQKMEMGPDYSWSGGLNLTQLLYSQSYFTSLKLARRMETLGELNLQQKKEEIIFQVSQLYYLCQTTNEQIMQLEATLEKMERLLDIVRLQNEQGIIRKVDYSRISVNKNNLQTQVDNLNQLYIQQLGLLKYLIGLPVETEIVLSDSLAFLPAVFFNGSSDLTNRTELQLLDKKIEMAELNRKINKQAYLPTLAGFGIYMQGQSKEFEPFNGDKFYRIGVVGIRMTIPIFDGFEKRSKTRQYDLELKQLQNTRENMVDYFSKEYADAIIQYNNSYSAVIRQEENIKLAEETYDVTLQGYRQQVVPLSDLLMSESGLTEARLSYYNVLMQLKNAELGVREAKGELSLLIEN